MLLCFGAGLACDQAFQDSPKVHRGAPSRRSARRESKRIERSYSCIDRSGVSLGVSRHWGVWLWSGVCTDCCLISTAVLLLSRARFGSRLPTPCERTFVRVSGDENDVAADIVATGDAACAGAHRAWRGRRLEHEERVV